MRNAHPQAIEAARDLLRPYAAAGVPLEVARLEGITASTPGYRAELRTKRRNVGVYRINGEPCRELVSLGDAWRDAKAEVLGGCIQRQAPLFA